MWTAHRQLTFRGLRLTSWFVRVTLIQHLSMSAIFLSHSSRDNPIAAAIRQRLSADGHRSVFLDFDPADGIPAGRDWEQELYRQLRACQAVIVLCSEHSMSSQWCFAEITHAKALGKPIFPAKIGPCEINTILTSRQMLDFTTGATAAYERLRRGLKAAGLDPASAFDWDGSRSPYPGLMAFDEPDAAVFFGRDSEIQQGLELLNRRRQFGGPRLLVVLGASGSGKSSLVRAGLIPRLRNNPADWLVLEPFRPRQDPFAELAVSLAAAYRQHGENRSPEKLREALAAGGSELAGGAVLVKLAGELRSASGRRACTVLLTIDQMEELLGASVDARVAGFLGVIQYALNDRETPLMVAGTLRSDFLGELQAVPAMRELRFDTLPVGPMNAESLARVIEGPAEKMGVDLERGLTQAMIEDAETGNALPLLAFTLRELYERYGGDGRLTADEYARQLGGLSGSVARAAEAVFEAEPLTPEQAADLRLAFLAMVRVNAEGQYARQAARFGELPESARPAIERFAKARLLVFRGEGSERVVEVAHEAIFRAWGRLKEWLEEDREFLLWRKRLEAAVEEWQRVGKHHSALLKGPALAEARRLAEAHRRRLSPDETALVETSVRVANDERRRRQGVVAGVIAGLAIAAVGGLWLWQGALRAQRKAEDAERVAKLALESERAAQAAARNAQEGEREARERELQKSVDVAWRGLSEPVCDYAKSQSYITAGIRQLYCRVAPYMDLRRLEELSGMKVFQPGGPHEGLAPKWDANTFGRYNPAFVQWASEKLIPEQNPSTQAIYNRFARHVARVYLLAHEHLEANPALLQNLVRDYRAGKKVEFFSELGKTWDQSPDLQSLPEVKGQAITDTSYLAVTAIRFWARRTVDGTAGQFHAGLRKVLQRFDPEFVARR